MDTALVFEDYVGLQSRAVLEVQAEHGHASVSRVPLARQAKRPSICKHQTLPGGTPDLAPGILHILGGGAAMSMEPLTVDELAALLKMSVGIRDPGTGHNKLQRWAATAGNLGSVELFVAARRVSGLAPGLYFYQPHEHSLACLDRHSGALDIDDFMRRSLLASSGGLPDVLVLFTGAYHRAARKYGPFAYRLINLDAGAAVSQLHIVAASLGIRSRTVTRWADDLIEHQLNLEPFVEQSTAVVALFRSASALPPQPASSPGRVVSRTGTPPSGKTARDFWELRVSEIAELLYRESRVKECELVDSPFPIPAEFLGVPYSGSSSVTIPLPAGGGRPVGRILAHRTTVRNYTDAPVTLDQLGTMLHYAQHGDAGDWPEEQREGNLLSFQVLAWRVQGLPPGVYAYDPPSHTLRLTAPAPSPENAIELLVQSEYAAAPVLVWIAANLAAACARHGAFGHRQLLLRAGSAGHRLWMAALGMGLSGSLIAGLVPGAARKQLGFDGYHLAGLFGVTTGYRARAGESSRPPSPPI
jgi:SagB-type dehydrogenase family enzyme